MKKTLFLLLFISFFSTSFSQWKPAIGNLTPRGGTLFSKNNSLYCIDNGVFVSDDMGVTWREGLRATLYPIYNIWGFTFVNNYLMVWASNDNENGLYVSSDNGHTWSLHSVPNINPFPIATLFYDGTALYSFPYVSYDNGYTWVNSTNGINNPYFSIIGYCQTPSSLFIYSNDEIYKTTNHGTTWTKVMTGLSYNYWFKKMIYYNGKILLAIDSQNFRISNDDGNTWSDIPGIFSIINDVEYFNNHVLAATWDGIYKLVNNTSWVQLNFPNQSIQSLEGIGNNLFAEDGSTVFRSTDMFSTYDYMSNGIHAGTEVVIHNINSRFFAVDDASYDNLYYSDNYGQQWSWVSSYTITGKANTIWHIDSLILIGTNTHCYSLTNPGLNFQSIQPAYSVSTPFFDFFNLDTSIYVAFNDGIYRSDKGNLAQWNNLNNDLLYQVWYGPTPTWVSQKVYAIDTLNGCLFIGTEKGIYKSDNKGDNWTQVLTVANATKLVSFNSFLLAYSPSGYYKSDATGTIWNPYVSNLPANLETRKFFKYNNFLFLGSRASGVFMSQDGGLSWENISSSLGGLTVNSFAMLYDYIYIGTSDGVWARALTDVSVNEQVTKSDVVLVFPNPTNNSITIERNSFIVKNYTLSLMDIQGRLLLSKQVEMGKTLTLDLL